MNNIILKNDNLDIAPRDVTTDDKLIDIFLCERAESSQRIYTRVISEFRIYIKDYFNIIDLKGVGITHISEYKNILLNYEKKNGSKLALSTVSQRLNIISGLFTFGKNIGYFRFNPVPMIKKPKFDNRNDQKFLTQQECTNLLKSLKRSSNNDILSLRNLIIGIFLLYSGLRISEICSVKWKDFYIDPKYRVGVRIKGKGSKYRSVKVAPEVWVLITEYRKILGYSAEINNNATQYLLLNKNRKQLTPSGARKVLISGAEYAGLDKKITPHWLRHTSASMALANGADIKKVMSQFGWSTLITPQRYLHDITGFDDAATDYIKINY